MNLVLLGLRPRDEVPRWIASSDLLLVVLRDLPVFQTVIPSKLFEFWAQERPLVLAAPHGECRRMVEESEAGYAIAPEDPAAMEDAIRRAFAEPEDAARRARLGRALVERDFLRDALARRMATFVERILSRR